MDKTIKELADEIGVSKTAVRKKIENLGLSDKLSKNGNQFAINKEQENLIKLAFQKKESQTENRKQVSENSESFQLVYDLVDTLKKELDCKNEIIRQQQETIDKLSSAISATSQQQLADKFIEGRKLIERSEEEEPIETPKTSWFKKWFSN